MALRLYLDGDDVIGIASMVSLSGSIEQCCRTLKAEIAASYYDFYLPVTKNDLGSLVRLYDGDELLFYGSLFTVKMATNSQTKTLVAFDMGYFLKNNDASYNFSGATAAEIARRVCGDHWVPVGSLAAPARTIKRKFKIQSLETIIDTAYTLAAESDGKKYMTRFVGAALHVIVKGEPKSATVIEGTANLQNLSYTLSSDGMVNRVKVYDSDGNLKLTRDSTANPAKTYGMRTKILTQREGDDIEKQIKAAFEDNDITRRITVNVLASNDMVTGNAVYLIEPASGLKGLFWIDEDAHVWQNGLHTATLTLNFKNIVREADAGTEED